jgi:apolipoprotein N-acyltransferase
MICYEAIFPHEVLDRGADAEWLVHITNDAWFGRIAGPQQHLAQARVRAIERGLPIARVANTGISGILGPHGNIVEYIPLETAGTLMLDLPGKLPMTLYHKREELPFVILFLIVLILFATLNIRRFRFS